MKNSFISIDLGTTNIKAVVYDGSFREASSVSIKVNYDRKGDFVEFDAEEYWHVCARCIREALVSSELDPGSVASIALTGQAESLVVLDRKGRPLRKAVSWLDERSREECDIIRREFGADEGYQITGLPDVVTTWPVTKMLWIKRNEPGLFGRAYRYLLIKDYIIFKMTGLFVSEYSVCSFTYYFNIVEKRYWRGILDFIGIGEDQLPELLEPGKKAGPVSAEAARELGLPEGVSVNTGALDHFAGMVGAGNIAEGGLSETTGTVMAIATLIKKPLINEFRLHCHCSAIRGSYALLPVCESGGISLEWFRDNFYPGTDFSKINADVEARIEEPNNVIFLPYLTGANSPEFNQDAAGVFYGLKIRNNKADLVRAVMEGIAFLLRKNIDHMARMGISVDTIVSLGGGSKSEVWNRMKADVTGKKIMIPENGEATSLGGAMLAAVEAGIFRDLEEASSRLVRFSDVYEPEKRGDYERNYEVFSELYERLNPLFRKTAGL